MWRSHLAKTVQTELQELFGGTMSQPSLSIKGLLTMAVSAVSCSICVHLAVSTCTALSYTCVDMSTKMSAKQDDCAFKQNPTVCFV